ncbi:hypothetical protein TrRE_jg2736 [Triparma retinervis]|uniref:Glutaredoxin domain-containing protein n=1 Tax=Triparma retinervis TaxID=2557542 RepID=A0A9W7AB94_9STRA|nr:hypothetical protein TrRE_jg2736 [Triparma retinervis]
MVATSKATISLFTLPSCPHCLYVKSALANNFPSNAVNIIDIQNYPTRRSDMIKLTSRFTVPQVFVNEHYIGGADDFKKFTGIFPEDKKVEPEGDMSWFEEPAKVEETRLRPVQESEKLVELPTPPFADKTDYASLIKADRGSANDAKTPSVLNCLVSYKDRVDPNPIAVVHRLKKQLDKIIENHRDDQQAVDYQAIKGLDEFLDFEVATAELQSIKLADMGDGVKKVSRSRSSSTMDEQDLCDYW